MHSIEFHIFFAMFLYTRNNIDINSFDSSACDVVMIFRLQQQQIRKKEGEQKSIRHKVITETTERKGGKKVDRPDCVTASADKLTPTKYKKKKEARKVCPIKKASYVLAV